MDNSTSRLNNEEPLVSILMLTYNRAHYLKEAITSVLNQTYSNWELIIIDDGSTDETKDIVATFTDSRIVYVPHSKNKGLHERRKESLGHTNGQYVAILDSDDLWDSVDKLREQVTFLETHRDCAVVGTFITVIDKDGAIVSKDSYGVDDSEIRNSLLVRNQFAHSSVLMRKTMLDMTNGYQPTLAEDLELFLQLGLVGTFANIPKFLTKHRIHSEGANDYGITMARALHTIIKKYGKDYPYVQRALTKNYLRMLSGYGKLLFKH